MNPELITKAGQEVGPLIAEAFERSAKAIAAHIKQKKLDKGKDVSVKLGSVELTTVGEDVKVKFAGEIADKTDIGSETKFVSLQTDMFDDADKGKTEGEG